MTDIPHFPGRADTPAWAFPHPPTWRLEKTHDVIRTILAAPTFSARDDYRTGAEPTHEELFRRIEGISLHLRPSGGAGSSAPDPSPAAAYLLRGTPPFPIVPEDGLPTHAHGPGLVAFLTAEGTRKRRLITRPMFRLLAASLLQLEAPMTDRVPADGDAPLPTFADAIRASCPLTRLLYPRPGLSGLRDCMNDATLQWLTLLTLLSSDPIQPMRAMVCIIAAIVHPALYGVASDTTRTGYAFGRNRLIHSPSALARADELIRVLRDRLPAIRERHPEWFPTEEGDGPTHPVTTPSTETETTMTEAGTETETETEAETIETTETAIMRSADDEDADELERAFDLVRALHAFGHLSGRGDDDFDLDTLGDRGVRLRVAATINPHLPADAGIGLGHLLNALSLVRHAPKGEPVPAEAMDLAGRVIAAREAKAKSAPAATDTATTPDTTTTTTKEPTSMTTAPVRSTGTPTLDTKAILASAPTSAAAAGLSISVDDDIFRLVNLTLKSGGLPDLTDLLHKHFETGLHAGVSHAAATAADLIEVVKHGAMRDAEARAAMAAPATVSVPGDAAGITGNCVLRPANEVFDIPEVARATFSFSVPTYEWSAPHPHVPAVDPGYIFRPHELLRLLFAITSNKRAYLHGHSGTGKTSLVEQVAARLGLPFQRINFDSEIGRMDLIGRDTLVSETDAEGRSVTVSKFIDGILPAAMSGPGILCLDEIDFVRADNAYVMQRALEGDALVITEDGGRIVKPHPMFRMIATANTVGQGDEHGLYQGARVQSAALLDRFGVWIEIGYLDEENRRNLVRSHVPEIDNRLLEKITKYSTEHLNAFTNAKVLQPLSPRGMVALAEALHFFSSSGLSGKTAAQQALAMTVLDRGNKQDKQVLMGIAQRVFSFG